MTSLLQGALEQINKEAKEVIQLKGSWRRAGQGVRKPGVQREMNNIRVSSLHL